MSEMKDSGLKYIGLIPSEWNLSKIKFEIKDLYSGGTPESGNSEFYDENGEKWVAIGDMSNTEQVYDTESHITKEGIKNKNLKKVPRDTILYSIYATIGKVSELKIDAYINQAILAIYPNSGLFNGYLKYTLKLLEEYALSECSNSIQNNLNALKVKNFPILQLNFEEQKMIAKILDDRIEKINIVLKDLSDEIESLEKYRKSLITETVIKGLKSNVKMKNTKIQWIEEISEEAKLIKLKYFSYMKGRIGWQGLNSEDFIEEGPYCVTGTDFVNGKINWETCYHVSDERYNMDSNIQLKIGDLLVTKDGTIGKLAVVDELPNKACLNSHLLIIRPLMNKFINKYLYYVMKSEIFYKYYNLVSSGSTMDSLSQEKTGNFIFPIYEIEKQKQIADYLDKKCKEIDELISDKQEQIKKMEQYKKSLIYEYVTGKKRVKGAEELYG